jgi:hypothetical protein
MPMLKSIAPEKRISGVAVLDLDGTLTTGLLDHKPDKAALSVVTKFVEEGGQIILDSGATRGRMERTYLAPIIANLEDMNYSQEVLTQIMKERVFLIPEAGSAVLAINNMSMNLGEWQFSYFPFFQAPCPSKDGIRKLLNRLIASPEYRETYIAGDYPNDQEDREYMMSWRKLQDPHKARKLILDIREGKIPIPPSQRGEGDLFDPSQIDWDNIEVREARTTVDFLHKDAQKHIALSRFMQAYKGLKGPIIGFSDWGDAFAKIVPTINVNPQNPNIFRQLNLASMDYNSRWRLMDEGEYDIHGHGTDAVVYRDNTVEEVKVIRAINNEILLAKDDGDKKVVITDRGSPIFYDSQASDSVRTIFTLSEGGYMERDGKYYRVNPKKGNVSPEDDSLQELTPLRDADGKLVKGFMPSMISLPQKRYRLVGGKIPQEGELELGDGVEFTILDNQGKEFETHSVGLVSQSSQGAKLVFPSGGRSEFSASFNPSTVPLSDVGIPLKDKSGRLILSPDGKEVRIQNIVPSPGGHPIEILMSPPTASEYMRDVKREMSRGCAAATADILKKLIEQGYFDKE